MMTVEIDLDSANREVEGMDARGIVRWAVGCGVGKMVVSTNFRPYEAVILHLVSEVNPGAEVLWVDHGHNRPATYLFAEKVIGQLGLQVTKYEPLEQAEVPAATLKGEGERTEEEDAAIHGFSEKVKLEPFRRGMTEMAPGVWITALRRVQNANRDGMRVVETGPGGVLKVNPLLEWSDADMEQYLKENDLPNEWDYFDPAKAGEKRECGLHNGKLEK